MGWGDVAHEVGAVGLMAVDAGAGATGGVAIRFV